MTDNKNPSINLNGAEIKRLAEDALKSLEPFEVRDVVAQQQKTINRQQAKIEALQMDNAQLQSDIINANQNLDHINSLYEAEKARVEKAKEKSIYFAKELQAATAEIERLQGAVEMYEEERKYHFAMSRQAIAEAIKEFAERLKSRLITVTYMNFDDTIDNLVKEMVGETNG